MIKHLQPVLSCYLRWREGNTPSFLKHSASISHCQRVLFAQHCLCQVLSGQLQSTPQNSLLGLLKGFPRLIGDTRCASIFSMAVGVPFLGGVHISCSSTPLDPMPRGPHSSCMDQTFFAQVYACKWVRRMALWQTEDSPYSTSERCILSRLSQHSSLSHQTSTDMITCLTSLFNTMLSQEARRCKQART
jgi:hypothetical protein